MTRRLALLVCGLTLLAATPARAQLSSWDDRGFLNLSGAGSSGSTKDFATSFNSFSIYQETATASATQTVKSGGGFFDITLGARVWNNIGIGFNYWKGSSKSVDAPVTASIPDPIFFDKPRAIATSITGLQYAETWVAVPFIFTIPATDKVDVMVFGGPALVSADLDVPNSTSFSMTVPEASSGPQLNFTKTSFSKKTWGYQFGVDGRYMITKVIGAGAFLRVTKATSNFNNTVSMDAGGVQVGGGLRVRF